MYDIEENEKKTQYLVPANVSIRFELWEGFGFSELKICLIVLAISGIIFYLSGLLVKYEVYDMNLLPANETIGLVNDENTTIEDDIVTKKVNIIPNGIRYLILALPTIAAYFCVKRDRSTGMSLIDNLINMRDFNKKQKRYLYKYRSGSEV
jgi:hypothetical protein